MIFDEFEKVNANNFKDAAFLSFLDGSQSRDGMLIIATVNDRSKLPSTLLERPGRFEMIVEFKISDPIIFEGIVNNLFPESMRNPESIERILNQIKSFKGECTIDHMRIMVRDELVSLIHKRNGSKVPTLTTLENQAQKFEESSKVGFKQNPVDAAKDLTIGELYDRIEEKEQEEAEEYLSEDAVLSDN